MSGEQELHDAEPGFGSHGGEHVGVAGYLGGVAFHYFDNSRNTEMLQASLLELVAFANVRTGGVRR